MPEIKRQELLVKLSATSNKCSKLTDASGGMCLKDMLNFKIGVGEDVNAALAACEIHLVARLVPHNFIDFKIELFFGADFVCFRVNERD